MGIQYNLVVDCSYDTITAPSNASYTYILGSSSFFNINGSFSSYFHSCNSYTYDALDENGISFTNSASILNNYIGNLDKNNAKIFVQATIFYKTMIII